MSPSRMGLFCLAVSLVKHYPLKEYGVSGGPAAEAPTLSGISCFRKADHR